MLTRPFTRLVVAFGVRKITQRRLVEEFVTGTLILIPFGLLVGLITSRICTKIQVSRIRSDVWTTLVVFLIGDILMEWLLPSLGCLPVPAAAHDEPDEVDAYVSSMFGTGRDSPSSFFRQDEFHYNLAWLLQSYGLYCPADFANSDSLLTPDATAILFSIRLVFLCIGVHIGESIGCFVALTGGIATGKSTAAKMFVDYNYDTGSEGGEGEPADHDRQAGGSPNAGKGNNNNNNNSNSNNVRNRRSNGSSKKPGSHKKGASGHRYGGNDGNNDDDDDDDDELIEMARLRDGEARGGLLSSVLGPVGSLLSAVASLALADDGSGVVYNEGTVQLICADSIAHNILLPPEVLAARAGETRGANGGGGNEGSDSDSEGRGGSFDEGDCDGGSEDQTPILRIVSPGDSVYHKILAVFGDRDILDPDTGRIDRLKLGAIIFSDRNERRKLNKITHPRILSVLLKKLVRSVFFGYADITMGDLPLLFESGKLSWLFGVTICVTTSEETQLARLVERNPELPREECLARIASQMSLSRKEALADIVIDNNGDLDDLREQVEEARRDVMGRLYGIGMSLLQMLLLIGGSTSIAVSSKFYTHWQQ